MGGHYHQRGQDSQYGLQYVSQDTAWSREASWSAAAHAPAPSTKINQQTPKETPVQLGAPETAWSREASWSSAAWTAQKAAASTDSVLSSQFSQYSLEKPDPAIEKKLTMKCDIRILPIMSWLLFLVFMDRFNVSNATAMGLPADLHLTSKEYSATFWVFLIPYILFSAPQNMMLRRVRPSYWLCFNWFGLGIITLAGGFVKNATQLLVCRFFVGVFESVVLPGVLMIMSIYFKPYQLQRRYNFFFSFTALGGAVGGLIGYGVAHMNGTGGLEGWRWIFILEGIVTTVSAIIAIPLMVDWPETVKFLTEPERAIILQRMPPRNAANPFNLQIILKVLKDWKTICSVLMFFPASNAGYAVAYFLPSIIQGLDPTYSATEVQVHTIPVWMTAWALCLIAAFLSDKIQMRYPFVLFAITIGSVGYIILLVPGLSIGARYAATFFTVSCFPILHPLLMTWVAQNVFGSEERALASGIMVGFGNCGGFVASNVFGLHDGPRYVKGVSATLGLLVFGGTVSTLYLIGIIRANKKKTAAAYAGEKNAESAEAQRKYLY